MGEFSRKNINESHDSKEKQGEILVRPPLIEEAQVLPFKSEILSPERIAETLKVPDLTQEGSKNAVNIIKEQVVENLTTKGFDNVLEYRRSPIVSIEDNFDILRFPADNAGRSSRYTRYVDDNHVLRTHTSANVPEALRSIAETGLVEDEELTLVMPGLCYRRDVTDKEHLGIFHQMDIWVIRRIGDKGAYTQEDLLRLAEAVYDTASPGAEKIVHQANHPYTIDGIEAYAEFNGDTLEIFEAGLVHPEVLERCGLSSDQYSGLALGMGLDRLVMAKKGMPDIRYIRSENSKVIAQMESLDPFIEISNQPPVARDISYVTDPDVTLEDVSDQLQIAFGENAYLIEHVDIKSVTQYQDLPENVRDRIGITPDKVNVLVNFTLRHPDRNLTKKEVNEISAIAYAKLHTGNTPGYIRE